MFKSFEGFNICEICPKRSFVPSIGRTILCYGDGPNHVVRKIHTLNGTGDDGEIYRHDITEWGANCPADGSPTDEIVPPEEVIIAVSNGAKTVITSYIDGLISEVIINM